MNEAHGALELIRNGVILLGAALAFVLLFRRFGLGAVLGYLVAGVVIGPQVLDLAGEAEAMAGVAELGITLLLFLVGLELNLGRLWRLRSDIFGFGLVQVVLCGLALALLIWLLTDFSPAASLALGLPLGLSSTAQVLPMLQSAGRLRTPFGERAFSVLLFQDLSIVPLITIVAALSRAPAAPDAPPGWLLGVYTVVAVVGLVLAGRYLLNPLFRLIGGMGEREMFVVAGLFTVLMSAFVMQSLGLSAALGAFVAGVMLADSPYRHELEADVDPFRSILLGLFFITVGMMLDLGAIADRPAFVIGMAILLIAVKTAIIFAIARVAGMDWRAAFSIGLLLSQGGEFGFVLFAQAENALLIEAEAASLFNAIVTLSMASTPFLMLLSRRFRTAPDKTGEEHEGPSPDGASAIVVGWGRFGQTVGHMMVAQGISVTMIDAKARQIETSQEFGFKVYFGDGTRIDLLRRAGAGDAQLILFCIDDGQPDEPTLSRIAEAFPDAQILVRTFDRRHTMKLKDAPIAGTVREVYESAIAMARQAMTLIDVDADDIRRAEDLYRKLDLARLAAQSETGDLHAASDIMLRPGDETPKVPMPVESG